MKRVIAVTLLLCAGLWCHAQAQEGRPVGPNSPCSAFGTASGTCAQGGVITAGGPTGSASAVPVITYNAAGQLTTVTTASLGTAAAVNTGTSGATIPLLNGANTASANWTFNGTQTVFGAVSGNAGAAQFVGSSSGNFVFEASSTGAPIITNVPNAATTSALCWNTGSGAITFDGTIGTCNTSDERLKTFDGRISDSLDKILSIARSEKFGYFHGKGQQGLQEFGSGEHIGAGAQTIARFFPELVAQGSDGLYSLAYDKLTIPIIAALSQEHKEVAELRREIVALKIQLDAVKSVRASRQIRGKSLSASVR